MDICKLLGKRIKELRIAKKLKQAELAEIIEVEPRSISRIESGYHFPKDKNLEKLASALDVEIKDLFEFSHLDDVNLIPQINNLLINADKQKLKLIYRIIKNIVT